jgi:nitrogen fixation/metabolism regulation signal transduction histidine kinase
MKRINLGRHNEAINWNRKDEIGELVSEYNKMVQKLEESAAALARSEREEAWREMAKQIAHEIKNPLTPMKLSIQYLQKALDQNAPNIRELSEQVSETLVDQIDHLSMIASEFSQFANIENARREEVNLNEVVGTVINLYRLNEFIDPEVHLLPGTWWVVADRSHLNRIFTNLFQNAVQAVPPGETPRIVVRQFKEDHAIVTSIQDNGTGIDEDLRERIFTPNFTTKTSGTGLGLAMCKRMVEHAGGEIWFESNAGEGATFFVRLPLRNAPSLTDAAPEEKL